MLEKLSLKDTDHMDNDYDISEMQYTFDFIRLVFKDRCTIDDAITSFSIHAHEVINSSIHFPNLSPFLFACLFLTSIIISDEPKKCKCFFLIIFNLF